MTVNLSTVTPETPLEDCLQIMESRNIFHLPVVDEKREYHGLVSAKDLLKVIAADCKTRAETLESYVFPRWA
jgi:CBS domain-containing protein